MARETPTVNSGSMADIAFLLLIFFLVTTTIASDKGIASVLPQKQEDVQVKIKERNIFNVLINSSDLLLVEDEVMNVEQMKREAMRFITNDGQDPNSSESPEKAIISLKTDRGTSYSKYIEVRDVLKQAYADLRAEFLGISRREFKLITEDLKNPENKEKYDKARKKYPEQISDAEPSNVGG